jgi:hypothetical protein
MSLQYKSKKERLEEVIKVLRLLRNLGIPQQNEGIIEITNILRQWVNDGKYQKGRIKLTGYERVIYYELYTRQNVEIAVNLKFVKGL